MISKKRKILFSLAPALLLLILLAITEGALRIFDHSLDLPLVSPVSYDGLEWLEVNRRYLEKYFPANVVLLPEFKPSLLKPQKSPGSFRVFCLGESSMFGTPYQMTATIPSIVRKQLRHIFPGREIEVVNFGASAINTNVIADLSDELIALKPDVVLLYTGHNEFYGPDGVGASFLEKRLPFLTSLKYRLREIRLVRLLQRGFEHILQRSTPAEEHNMMKLVSEGAQVSLRSNDAERIFALFENNLRKIAGAFKKANIPIIVSDVSSNLLFPPFSYVAHAEFKEIERDFAAGAYAKIEEGLRSAIQADPENSYISYWLGRSYLAQGKADSGKPYLVRARDFDLLKFRAPKRTNQIISRVCSELDVPYVSSDSCFCSESPLGIPGPELFWEHLHPKARGYYLIADLFLNKISQLNLLPVPNPRSSLSRLLPFSNDSLSLCWLDLAYADLSMRHLTTQWPFSNYRVNTVVIDSADQELKQIAYDVYTRTMMWNEGCYRTAFHFQRIGRYKEAGITYTALIDDYPYNFYAHYLLGILCKETGNLAEAAHHYERSIEIKHDYPYSRVELGLLEINAGRFDDAIIQLATADSLTRHTDLPAVRASALYGLSAAFANIGDILKAREYIDQSLKLSPTYEPAKQLKKSLQSPLAR